MAFQAPEWTKASNIYEANIRCFTAGGNILGFRHHLKRLKDMGVDIIWLMPIFPISKKNRKGTLGSPYSISDYKSINPEYGTFDDFDKLVKEAHKLNMHIILDWVANHTGWDHIWISMHPERYHRDEYGSVKRPNDDWTDTAHLNYSNPDTVEAMIDCLKFWVEKFDIDGYRCDMAGLVPNEFWIKARRELDKVKKNLFWLAEWDDPKIHQAFDMSYTWQFQALMAQICKGEKNVYDLDHARDTEIWTYAPENYRLYFSSNHDENSWHGSEYQRYGDGAKSYAVLSYTLPGMPLIYSGQESAFNRALPFFEKDEIQWGDYPLESFYRKLNELKHSNQALWNGIYGGSYSKIYTTDNNNIYAFARIKGLNKVLCFFNLSCHRSEFKVENELLVGNYENWFANSPCSFSARAQMILQPWEYKIFVSI